MLVESAHSAKSVWSPKTSPLLTAAAKALNVPLNQARPVAWVSAVCILLAGLALTFASAHQRRATLAAEDLARFQKHVDHIEADVVRRFELPVYGLKGARGMYAAMRHQVDRAAFRAYVQSRDLPAEFPGVHGFGFVERVARKDLATFLAAERADDAPSFDVKSQSSASDELFIIKHIEPMSENRPAWGFDLASERVRRAAIERAIDTGEETLTGRVSLVQDPAGGPGFIYLVPIFREGSDPVTPAQRRAAVTGLLYAPIIATEILSGTKEREGDAIDFRLLIAPPDRPSMFETVFDSRNLAAHSKPAVLAQSRTIRLGSQEFRLDVEATPAFVDATDKSSVLWIFASGALLSVMLAAMVWLLVMGRARALAMATSITADLDRMASELISVNQAQEEMLDNDLVAIVKLQDRQIIWKSRAAERLFGYGTDELKGESMRKLYIDDQSFEAIGQLAYPILSRGGHFKVRWQMIRKDGDLLWVDLSGVMLPGGRDESLWMMLDATQEQLYRTKVERAAFHDALTGLANRTLLLDRLGHALAQAKRQASSLSVCYLDLDGFKAINDTHGHDAGDEVLREVARRLLAVVRAGDTVARMGGDEFVVLLAPVNDPPNESELAAQRMLSSISQPIALANESVAQVGSSIGIAHYPHDADGPDALLSLADQLMFEAKRSGKGTIRCAQLSGSGS